MDDTDFRDEIAAVAVFRTERADFRLLPAASRGAAADPAAPRGPSIVTRSRLHVELGGPDLRSASFVLMTTDASLVEDRRASLLGPDLGEVERGTRLPFGQVLIARGEGLDAADYEALADCPYLGDAVAGYMVRSRSGAVWGRAATDAVDGGLGFADLASALRRIVMERLPSVTAVETLFVTSSDADVDRLMAVGATVEGKAAAIHASLWADRGVDTSAPSFVHCGSCGERDVCSGLRRIARLRARGTEAADPACGIPALGAAQ